MSESVENLPRVLTSRQLIRTVADRWRGNYFRNDEWGAVLSGSSEDVWKRLSQLEPETATSDDVSDIIGNDSWTTLRCNGCDERFELVVQVGELPDWESATVNLCPSCLQLAVDVLHATTK